MDQQRSLCFINNEALDILNLKREVVLGKSAQEIAMRNDLLRRLLVGMGESKEPDSDEKKSAPLKIYADNKESYFQVKYLPVRMTDSQGDVKESGTVILLKNITEFHKLDVAKTTFISTISHELKTPISAILMSQQLLADKRVGALNPEQRELSDSIKENGERLLSITGELLNMTQVESGALQLKPHITMPPLRLRREDIPLLAQHFIDRYAKQIGRPSPTLSDEVKNSFLAYSWPGNVREMMNAIEHALIVCEEEITQSDLPIDMLSGEAPAIHDDSLDLKSVERNHIIKVLHHTHGNKTETARLLKIGLTTLYRKIEEYGIRV